MMEQATRMHAERLMEWVNLLKAVAGEILSYEGREAFRSMLAEHQKQQGTGRTGGTAQGGYREAIGGTHRGHREDTARAQGRHRDRAQGGQRRAQGHSIRMVCA